MYQLLCNFKEEDMDNVWKNIWALRVTERNKHFHWIALYNRLLTNYIKAHMGFGSWNV
jgi:hypothetical protein